MSPSTHSPTSRHAWLDIHLPNLVTNARTVQEAAGGAPLLPMVKADGYGVGAGPVVEALEVLDPWGYGVATVQEAVALRDAGVRRPLLVFTPARAEWREAYAAHDLRAVLDDPETAARWDLPFHLEIDTGMGRCGVRWDDAPAIARCRGPGLEGVFTHFYAPDTDPGSVMRQWHRFQEALAALPAGNLMIHAAGSAAAWRLRERLDLVRPGVFLYGGRHASDLPPPEPVVTLRAPVVSVRRIRRGDGVSYGHDWTAPGDRTIATLAAGYADGIPRGLEGHGAVLLGGGRRAIVGRVTMDFVMVDMGEDAVAAGDIATLIGRNGENRITVDEFAAGAGTNAYELLARLGARLQRHYVSS